MKGLLSDDNGKTFQEWVNYLGGKSVNGNPVLFPIDEAAPSGDYTVAVSAVPKPDGKVVITKVETYEKSPIVQ